MSGLNGFIQSAKSGTFGIIGLLLLAMIAIQLFIAIEKAFNDIWGVRRGRSFMNRINSYLTFILASLAFVFASRSAYLFFFALNYDPIKEADFSISSSGFKNSSPIS